MIDEALGQVKHLIKSFISFGVMLQNCMKIRHSCQFFLKKSLVESSCNMIRLYRKFDIRRQKTGHSISCVKKL